jgi:hypothetical protein
MKMRNDFPFIENGELFLNSPEKSWKFSEKYIQNISVLFWKLFCEKFSENVPSFSGKSSGNRLKMFRRHFLENFPGTELKLFQKMPKSFCREILI